MAEEHCVARGPTDHGEHREPHVRQRLRGEAAVTDAQHVGHGLEQGPRVLLQPVGLLQGQAQPLNTDLNHTQTGKTETYADRSSCLSE